MHDQKSWIGYVSLPIACMLASGCGHGAMGQSTLLREPGPDATGMQGPLAVGAAITPTVNLDIQGSSAPLMRLQSGRPDVLRARDNMLVGQAPGVSAVLITNEQGTVLDFIHLWVVAPSRVVLHRLDSERQRRGTLNDTIELVVGESLFVAPVAYAGSQELAGTAQSDWSVALPIADVLRDGDVSRRRLIARAPGRTTVTVRTLGLSASFDLVVIQ